MSLQWADFPSGQVGLYGTDTSKMLNGTPWVSLGGGAELRLDPDTTLPKRGFVWIQSGGPSTMTNCGRFALNEPNQKVGLAFNVWPLSIIQCPIAYLASTGNTPRFTIGVFPNGGLTLHSTSGTVLAIADYPILRANSWQHVEINGDVVTGEVEVRVKGITIPELSGTFTAAGGTIGIIGFPDKYDGGGDERSYLFKDVVAYTGAGSQFNSFLGNVTVNDLYPDADVDLQWDPSSGAEGWSLIKDDTPGNRLSVTGSISSGEQIQIGGVYYRWTSGSVDAGTPAGTSANPWLVAYNASVETCLLNVFEAINASGTPGTTYSTALTAHPTMKAVGYLATLLEVEPQDGLTTGQSCTETMAGGSWAKSSTYWYGPSDTSYLQAGYTPAVAATGNFTVSGGVPIADETFAIGANTWTFKASRGSAFEVTIGTDEATTAANMISAINTDQTVGVTASDGGSGIVTVTAVTAGTSGNSITTTESATNVSVSGATLSGGVDTIYPDPDIVSFTNLDPNVTSVKGLMNIIRAAKTDGGDGSIQTSLSPNGTDWDDGTNRPITAAQTYYWDPSELSPATGSPWTIGEVNTLQGKMNRTL